MKRTLFLVALLFAAVPALAQKPLTDAPGVKDHPLFTRMPGYFLVSGNSVVEKEFDSADFYVKGAKGNERTPIEGHYYNYRYRLDKTSGSSPSGLQIMRNYQTAAAPLGGKVVFEDRVRTTIVITKGGKETWVEVAPVMNGNEYWLKIVERQAMQQAVVGNAAAFKAGLAQSGHVEVPGIFFDTGKSEVKPESQAALGEVVKLLQGDPALKVWVVGHTDNTGAAEMNATLSQARAAAVVKSLVQMGIPAARMAPHGAGPYAPVAENGTEEGRAKNRRVELVARQQ